MKQSCFRCCLFGYVGIKTEGIEWSAFSAQGQNQSESSLIPSEVAPYPFNPAEPCACVRLDPDKPDNLRPNGDYDELAMCSLFHVGLK